MRIKFQATAGMMMRAVLRQSVLLPSARENQLFVPEATRASQRGGRATAALRSSPLARVRILPQDVDGLVQVVRVGLSGRNDRNHPIVLKVPLVGVPAATAAARRAALVRMKISLVNRGHRTALAQTMDFRVNQGRLAVLVRTKVSLVSRGRRAALAQTVDFRVNQGRLAVPARREDPVRPNVTVEVRQGNPAAKGLVVDSNLSRVVTDTQSFSHRLSFHSCLSFSKNKRLRIWQ